MPKFLHRYLHSYGRHALPVLTGVLLILLAWQAWYLALSGLIALGLIIYFQRRRDQLFQEEFETYISTLRHRVRKAGVDVLAQLPLGIILYDEEQVIQWHNRYLLHLLTPEQDTLVGSTLEEASLPLARWLEKEEREGVIRSDDRLFTVTSYPEERLIYLQDQTQYFRLKEKRRQERVALLHLHLDNLEEVSQSLDEQHRSILVSRVTNTLTRWAQEHGILLIRTDSDKFFGVLTEQTLQALEASKFDILDRVRELTSRDRWPITRWPITLSIGIGAGEASILELGRLAQSGLDLALGRGGDQVALKRYPGHVAFYGGKSSAMEKRTRVRARVISHALRDMIVESDRVFVMGHRNPDLDALGAAIGVLKAVQVNDRPGHLLLDREKEYPGVSRLLAEIEKEGRLAHHFLSPSEAIELITEKSLLILVDVHKPQMVLEPQLLDRFDRKVVIDHHRRGEDFIVDPLLVYIEPYASSASELVAELLIYQGDEVELSPLEATAMLAGMVVDTNNFSLRTGSRTFEAAAFLRSQGADPVLVQKILKEDKEQFLRRYEIVAGAELYRGQIAIATAEYDPRYGQILLAQAADTLLTLDGVAASFVLCERGEGEVLISARSLGEINVQVIMEQMHGGGHLTNAATQLEETSVPEAIEWLKEVLDDYLEGGRER